MCLISFVLQIVGKINICFSNTYLSQLFDLRIKLLYMVMSLPVPSKGELKRYAKTLKKFCVLIKCKLQKGQLCRDYKFRKLMALVHDPDEQNDEDEY